MLQKKKLNKQKRDMRKERKTSKTPAGRKKKDKRAFSFFPGVLIVDIKQKM